jgi:hypothetical protein
MGRGRTRLDAGQQAKLKAVHDADDAWRDARKHALAEARLAAEEKIAQFAAARDVAVYEAWNAKIPKALIGQDGLGTSNPYAVTQCIERVEAVGAPVHAEDSARFSWGEILAADEHWIYGWVLDAEEPDAESDSPATGESSPGIWVMVDRKAGVVPSFTWGNHTFTQADPEFPELREWAVAHEKDVDPA